MSLKVRSVKGEMMDGTRDVELVNCFVLQSSTIRWRTYQSGTRRVWVWKLSPASALGIRGGIHPMINDATKKLLEAIKGKSSQWSLLSWWIRLGLFPIIKYPNLWTPGAILTHTQHSTGIFPKPKLGLPAHSQILEEQLMSSETFFVITSFTYETWWKWIGVAMCLCWCLMTMMRTWTAPQILAPSFHSMWHEFNKTHFIVMLNAKRIIEYECW